MTEHRAGEDAQSVQPGLQGSEHDDMVRLLVCPADHGQLRLEGDILSCTMCGRRYPIEDGVPNMLLNEDHE